jgi:hypothetical protein
MKPFKMEITPKTGYMGSVIGMETDVRQAFIWYGIEMEDELNSDGISVFYSADIPEDLREYLREKYKVKDIKKPGEIDKTLFDEMDDYYDNLDPPWLNGGPWGNHRRLI